MTHEFLTHGKGMTDLTIYMSPDKLMLYFNLGLALMEVVPNVSTHVQYRMALGRMVNADWPLRDLGRTFGHDHRSLMRWGDALKSTDPVFIARMFAGRGPPPKVTDAVASFVYARHKTLRGTVRDFRKRIAEEVFSFFNVKLSGESLRQLFRAADVDDASDGAKDVVEDNNAVDGAVHAESESDLCCALSPLEATAPALPHDTPSHPTVIDAEVIDDVHIRKMSTDEVSDCGFPCVQVASRPADSEDALLETSCCLDIPSTTPCPSVVDTPAPAFAASYIIQTAPSSGSIVAVPLTEMIQPCLDITIGAPSFSVETSAPAPSDDCVADVSFPEMIQPCIDMMIGAHSFSVETLAPVSNSSADVPASFSDMAYGCASILLPAKSEPRLDIPSEALSPSPLGMSSMLFPVASDITPSPVCEVISCESCKIPASETPPSRNQSTAPPPLTLPLSGRSPPPAPTVLHHAGQLLFSTWLDQKTFNPVESLWVAQILQDAVNIEQSKTLCHKFFSKTLFSRVMCHLSTIIDVVSGPKPQNPLRGLLFLGRLANVHPHATNKTETSG